MNTANELSGMSSAPYFSVVIPVFNRPVELHQALVSCVNQTFSDFEVVVVDDGSAKEMGISGVVSSFDDPRFHYIRQSNAGGGAARNTGIKHSRGKYIAFLDSDDEFLPSKLYEAAKYLSVSHEPLRVWFSRARVDRGAGVLGVKPARAPYREERIDDYLIAERGFIQSSCLVVDRLIAQEVGWDAALPFGQDADYVIRLWEYGCSFFMHYEPLTIFNDIDSTDRVTKSRKFEAMLAWTDRMGDRLSLKARLSFRGWHVAKAARHHSWILAVRLYFEALIGGAYSPKMALIVACQVFMSPKSYRRLTDEILKRGKWLRLRSNPPGC